MAKFSASDVAMTGFGVVAKRPVLLIWWTLLHLVFMGALSALFVIVAGPALTQMIALRAQGAAIDPEAQAQVFALFRQIIPLYLVMIPVMLVFYAVLYAAMNRAVLRPAKSAFGYLRLGMDEWRQFLLFLWALLVAFVAYIVIAVVVVILVIVGSLIFTALQKGQAIGGGGATLGVIALGLLCMGAYIYVLTRLSLASAMTFDTGKVSLLKSWRLTKGRFWSMFGAYVLTAILSIVVSLLGAIVIIVCTMLTGGIGGPSFIFHPDMSSPTAYFTTARLVYFVLAGVLYALVWPILLTPPAAIYKALTAKPEPTPASWPVAPVAPPPPPEPLPSPEPLPPEPLPVEPLPPEPLPPEAPVSSTPLDEPPAPEPFVEPPADPEHL